MLDSATPSAIKIRSSRSRGLKIFVGLAFLLLLAIVVPPFVNINRFRRSIVQSISQGLGRPVNAGAVELTLLPRPAFVLHRFTVAEDPAYGAEPVLMADTVTASLRASTLWHLRVEIATLHFDAPSLNLTRNQVGQWDFETLLHSSSRSASPPSSQSASSTKMPFPYVEASQARINFKQGAEKLPFSLEGADLAVWKESGSEWHLRVKARPVRTDLTVADAGQIRGNAVLQAAGPLENAPIHINLEWRRVELGEISRMLHGEDNSWRGMVDWTAQAQGTLAAAQVSTDVQISELRRAEFVPPAEMDLHAHCLGTYVRASNALDALQCSAPLATGWLRLQGRSPLPLSGAASSALSPATGKKPSATVALQHVPAQYVLDIFRHIHPGVSAEAKITGELTGAAECRWAGLHSPHFCNGRVQSTALALTLPQLDRPIQLSPLTLAASSPATPGPAKESLKSRGSRYPAHRHPVNSDTAIARTDAGTWQLHPARIALGAASPATLSGSFTSTDFTLALTGPASLREVVRLSQALRVPAMSGAVLASRGTAQLALALKAAWLPQTTLATAAASQLPFTPSQWTGNVQIRNAIVTIGALRGPLRLASAQVDLTPSAIAWNRLSGSYGHIPFEGSLRWRTVCPASTQTCSRTFSLHVPNLDPAIFIAALHPASGPSNLLEIVNPWAPNSPQLPRLQGEIDVDTLTLGKLSVEDAALELRMAGHTAELLSLSGNVFGGTIAAANPAGSEEAEPDTHSPAATDSAFLLDLSRAAGSAYWGDGPPVYTLRATLTRIEPDSVATLWGEHWGSGVADAAFSLHTNGWSAADLTEHAQGKFSIYWANGTFTSTGAAKTVMAFQSWRAAGQLSDRKLVLRSSQIAGWNMSASDAPADSASTSASDSDAAAPQTVTGAISFARVLDLQLQPSEILLTGPLDSPTLTIKKDKSGAILNQP